MANKAKVTNQGFVGVVYDILNEVVIERGACIRKTREEALEDAKQLCDHVNAYSEDYNDRIVDREVDAYVSGPEGIEY